MDTDPFPGTPAHHPRSHTSTDPNPDTNTPSATTPDAPTHRHRPHSLADPNPDAGTPSVAATPHTARLAVPGDAEELVRLRGVMLASMHGGEPAPGEWQAIALATLHKQLSDPDGRLAAFVIDRPARTGLAACAVGIIESRLGSPNNPSGDIGYIFNVATDKDQRRQGFSRACMEALLAWFATRGVTRIDLSASIEGEPLYHRLGFRRTSSPRMQLNRHRTDA